MHAEQRLKNINNNFTYIYLALLAWLPIPLGSKHPWAISVAEVWCYLLAATIVIKFIRTPSTLPKAFITARIALALLAVNILWLLVQCMQMPIGWLQLISPAAANLYSNAASSSAYISLDIGTTLYQLQVTIFLAIFFCLTLYLIDSKKKLKWLILTVLVSALVQVIYGSLMILTGTEYAFFISKAALHSHIGSATGTFTNRDHLAGYLEMALALGVGYMLTMLSANRSSHATWKARIRQWSELLLGPKARLRLLLILLCLGLVLTHSRGGNLGFFASLGIAGFLFLLFARHKPKATVIFLTSLIVLDIIIIGSWVGVSKVMTRLEKTSIETEQRDDAYLATLPMIQDYFITGTGAGSYFETFPAYKTALIPGYWNHAHNDYLEILSEQGIIGFSLLAGVVMLSFFIAIQTIRKRRSAFTTGLGFASLMGITALLIHSSVDFNLQILANSSLFMVILAIPFIVRTLKVQEQKSAFKA